MVPADAGSQFDAGNQTPAIARPRNARDDDDRRAAEAFVLLLDAVRRGRSALANALAEDIAGRGYNVERAGGGFRLVTPRDRLGRVS